MKDILLAQQLAALFNNADFASLNVLFGNDGSKPADIYATQAAEIIKRPSLLIHGEYEPYLDRRKGTLSFEVRSRIGDESAGQHQARFEQLYVSLLGARGANNALTLANRATAKQYVKDLLAPGGLVAIIDYGPARDAIVADSEGDDLRTVLTLNVVWRFLP